MIDWNTETTWNPWHGCHKVSQGCKNCYMFRDKERYGQDPNVVVRSKTKFYDPLKWQEPLTIFTCSWSDFFIEEADAWRDEAFAIMALTPQHTYQVLTKRTDRMREYLNDPDARIRIAEEMDQLIFHKLTNNKVLAARRVLGMHDSNVFGFTNEENPYLKQWPLPNVHLGVSVEDQKTADERIPILLETPAAVRWLSMEPLLGPVDLRPQAPEAYASLGKFYSSGYFNAKGDSPRADRVLNCFPRIDWVVVGGESGPGARPMHPDWARSIRDQCLAAGVPFFFKQWGEWAPDEENRLSERVGKTKAGRILDGRTWDEMPEVSK